MQVDENESPPANALLMLVRDDGIPLLIRVYGDVCTPPSAAVGIASALYHAAKRGEDRAVDRELRALVTKNRSVVYEMTATDLLLVYAFDKLCDGCSSSTVLARRMLCTVFEWLLLLLGRHNLCNWNASKLRAAIAKQVEVVDTIITTYHTDPRFVFGRPVRDIVTYRQLQDIDIDMNENDRLLQGAWLENGELVSEFFKHNRPKVLEARELLLLTVLGECVERKESKYTHFIGRVQLTRIQRDAKVVICNSAKGPLTTFIGIYDGDAEDDEKLIEMADKLLMCRAKACVRAPECLLKNVPNTFICAYVSRLGDSSSPSCRTLVYLNPSWMTVLRTEQRNLELPLDIKLISRTFWWRELCRFAAHRQSATDIRMPLSYKQEDESFTFLQHVRGSVQFVSMCIGSIPLAGVVSLGDALAEAMLDIQ